MRDNIIMGSISGNSTNPIMHVLLPLLFSFIAGLSIYIIASGKSIIKKV